MNQQGIQPDVVVFHSAWGEGLYLRDIWPQAALVAYPELYAQARLMGHGFDPEAGSLSEGSRRSLRRQNFMALSAIADADAAIARSNGGHALVSPAKSVLRQARGGTAFAASPVDARSRLGARRHRSGHAAQEDH